VHEVQPKNAFSRSSHFPIMAAYLLPIALYDAFHPRRSLPAAAPSAARLLGEIVALLVVYDALFYCVHRLLHASRPVYLAIHAKHHEKPGASHARNPAMPRDAAGGVAGQACSLSYPVQPSMTQS